MRLSFTKQFMVVGVLDTKNPEYKNYQLFPTAERGNTEAIIVFSKVLPLEQGKVYTLEMGLAMEKKTFTERNSKTGENERKQYDIAKVYINGVREENASEK